MLIPLGFQQITDLSAAVGLTVPTGALYALVQPEGQDIRYRDDGNDPTATVGMRILVNSLIMLDTNIHQITFIETTASATLNVSYYRGG